MEIHIEYDWSTASLPEAHAMDALAGTDTFFAGICDLLWIE